MAQYFPIQTVPGALVAEQPSQAPGAWTSPNGSEPEKRLTLASVLDASRRHWILITSIVLLSVTGAFIVTRFSKPVYRASTTLYFAERGSTVPALDVLSEIDNGNREVATEMEVMRSRALAEAVIDTLGLQVAVASPKGASTGTYLTVTRADSSAANSSFEFVQSPRGSFVVSDGDGKRVGSAAVGVPFDFSGVEVVLLPQSLKHDVFRVDLYSRESALASLVSDLKVSRPNATASVVKISYTSHDPLRTRDVPDVLARTYISWRANIRKSGDRSTVKFLQEQIDTIARQLYAAEEALRHFRQNNQVVDLPTQATAQVQGLASLEAQKAEVDMQRTSLKRLMRDVKSAPADPRLGSPYRRLMAFPSLMTASNPALPLLQSLTTLEEKRSELLTRRTQSDPDVLALSDNIKSVEQQIAAVVDTYVSGMDQQASSLAMQIGQFRGQAAQVPRKEVEYARLERSETGLSQIYTMLQTRFREAQIAEAVDDGSVRVVDPAALPIAPVAPRPLLNLVLGMLLGLLLAFAAVVLREHLDRTIHSREDVEAISGSAVLALIPHISADDRAHVLRPWSRLIPARIGMTNGTKFRDVDSVSRLLLDDPQSLASEAYRKLRTNLTFARPDSPPRVLVFTSPAAGDGKSTSVMNLAIALVQQGKRVIVIDADMRRGGLHKMLSALQAPGLSELLAGQAELQTAIRSFSVKPFGTVDLIPTGSNPHNPAELLASSRFGTLIAGLSPTYDAVLIDSPPINVVTDAAIIGRETDGAVFVVRAAKTTRAEISHAITQLRHVQVPVTGIVLNDYSAKRDSGYNATYYYGYSYEARPTTEKS
jgi:capsular exopolysaccharide synthesis family protein